MVEVFRKSLFGYSKQSVVTYISELNEDFSKKLLEKDLECKQTVQELKAQIEVLKRENEALQAGRQDVAGALIDAKAFAAELKEQAEAEDQAQRAKNEAYRQAELQRLQDISAHIDALRSALRDAICGIDAEMEQHETRCQAVQEEFCQEMPDTDAAAEVQHVPQE